MQIDLLWSEFKNIVAYKEKVRFVDRGEFYLIYYSDNGGTFQTSVLKDSGSDQSDFESNYKNQANKKSDEQKDTDGATLQRIKVTSTGWHYQLHGIEFTTSKLNSIQSKKADGTDWNFTTIKFYKLDNGSEVEITGDNLNQTFLDSNCIKTVVDWEPTFDIDIIGGFLRQSDTPAEDIELWIVGAPDISTVYGGSKEFVSNLNLKLLSSGIDVDGKTPKFVPYNSVYHSGKFRLILRHSTGYQHKLHMIFEIFKA